MSIINTFSTVSLNQSNFVKQSMNGISQGINNKFNIQQQLKATGDKTWMQKRMDIIDIEQQYSPIKSELTELAKSANGDIAELSAMETDSMESLLEYNKKVSEILPDRAEGNNEKQLEDIKSLLNKLKEYTESIAKYEKLASNDSLLPEEREFYNEALSELKEGLAKDTVYLTNKTRTDNNTLTSGKRIRDALEIDINVDMTADEMYAVFDNAEKKLSQYGVATSGDYDATLLGTDNFETRHMSHFLQNEGAELIQAANFKMLDQGIIDALDHIYKPMEDGEKKDDYNDTYEWQKLEEGHFDFLMELGIEGDAASLESLLSAREETKKLEMIQVTKTEKLQGELKANPNEYVSDKKLIETVQDTKNILMDKLKTKQFKNSLFIDKMV